MNNFNATQRIIYFQNEFLIPDNKLIYNIEY